MSARGGRIVEVLLGVGAVGAVAYLFLRGKKAFAATGSPRSRGDLPSIAVLSHSATEWTPLLKKLGEGLSVPAMLAWLDQESAGNVCAIGNKPPPGQKYPTEYGLSQLDANDPSNIAIMSQAAGRAACQNSGVNRSDWEVQLRPLTDVEKDMHARSAIEHIRAAHQHALEHTAGWNWAPDGVDMWKMSKLWHAGPGYVALTKPVFTALGRAPRDFAEFQDHANTVGLQKGYKQENLNKAWNNIANFARRLNTAKLVA